MANNKVFLENFYTKIIVILENKVRATKNKKHKQTRIKIV